MSCVDAHFQISKERGRGVEGDVQGIVCQNMIRQDISGQEVSPKSTLRGLFSVEQPHEDNPLSPISSLDPQIYSLWSQTSFPPHSVWSADLSPSVPNQQVSFVPPSQPFDR